MDEEKPIIFEIEGLGKFRVGYYFSETPPCDLVRFILEK